MLAKTSRQSFVGLKALSGRFTFAIGTQSSPSRSIRAAPEKQNPVRFVPSGGRGCGGARLECYAARIEDLASLLPGIAATGPAESVPARKAARGSGRYTWSAAGSQMDFAAASSASASYCSAMCSISSRAPLLLSGLALRRMCCASPRLGTARPEPHRAFR
jgi:hypothetical protein